MAILDQINEILLLGLVLATPAMLYLCALVVVDLFRGEPQ